MTQAKPKIGVFGGAFDPPHMAHAALVEAAIAQLGLDSVYVVPTGVAWHKMRALSHWQHRLTMTQLAFSAHPKVVVDDRETRRRGPSYTVETLLELKAEQPAAQLFLIIGGDQASQFGTWHRWREVVKSATICVAVRGDIEMPHDDFEADFGVTKAAMRRFLRLDVPPSPLSATAIRARVAHAEPIAALVGEPVARYIAQHHLYLQT